MTEAEKYATDVVFSINFNQDIEQVKIDLVRIIADALGEPDVRAKGLVSTIDRLALDLQQMEERWADSIEESKLLKTKLRELGGEL